MTARSFLTGHGFNPSDEELFGTPEELREDAEVIPMREPLRLLLALCLRCQTISEAGRFQWMNEPVVLPNGHTVHPDDWLWEASKAHFPTKSSEGFRRAWFCSHCELDTWHVAEGIK